MKHLPVIHRFLEEHFDSKKVKTTQQTSYFYDNIKRTEAF